MTAPLVQPRVSIAARAKWYAVELAAYVAIFAGTLWGCSLLLDWFNK